MRSFVCGYTVTLVDWDAFGRRFLARARTLCDLGSTKICLPVYYDLDKKGESNTPLMHRILLLLGRQEYQKNEFTLVVSAITWCCRKDSRSLKTDLDRIKYVSHSGCE